MDKTRFNILTNAIETGDLSIVKMFHQGFDDQKPVRLNDYIQKACFYGHVNIIQYLHENGANIREQKDNCLLITAREGHLEALKYLIQNGADKNSTGLPEHPRLPVPTYTALDLAMKHNHKEMVEYLRSL